jgi:hypothetical protein
MKATHWPPQDSIHGSSGAVEQVLSNSCPGDSLDFCDHFLNFLLCLRIGSDIIRTVVLHSWAVLEYLAEARSVTRCMFRTCVIFCASVCVTTASPAIRSESQFSAIFPTLRLVLCYSSSQQSQCTQSWTVLVSWSTFIVLIDLKVYFSGKSPDLHVHERLVRVGITQKGKRNERFQF